MAGLSNRVTALAGILFLAQALPAGNIVLVDSTTGHPVRDTAVTIASNDGTQCVLAPCPANGREWYGRTDPKGVVAVPDAAYQYVTVVAVTGYERHHLPPQARKSPMLRVELDPEGRTQDREGGTLHRVKIVDASTGRPLANTVIWLSTNPACGSPQCAGRQHSTRTNSIGNVFLPHEIIRPTFPRILIGAAGYRNRAFGKWPERIALDRE